MSRPTEIMLVARATSTGSGSRPKTKSRRCPRHIISRDARCDFHRFFNDAIGTLRELGGARRIVEDEVRDRAARYGTQRQRVDPRDGPFVSCTGQRNSCPAETLQLAHRIPLSRLPARSSGRARTRAWDHDPGRRCRDRAAPVPARTIPCAQRNCLSCQSRGGKMLVRGRSKSAAI
jgi:hypothetical protein